MKDFVLDEVQLDLARSLGADAVLLIVAALSDEELARLHRAARDRGLAVLVEAHDAEEVRRALAVSPEVVGLNARDLKTFSVDLGAVAAAGREIPSGVVRVAESGIRTAADVTRLGEAGFGAFLVGETLLRSGDGAKAIRYLLGRGTTEVKICGVTREEDVETCLALGVDWIGLIFAPRSHRRLTPERGRALAERARGVKGVVAETTGRALCDGLPVLSTPAAPGPGRPVGSGVYISDIFTGFRKSPHFIIAVMVRERNKNWILRATIDSEIVDNLVRAAMIGKHGDAFLVNRGNILQTNPRFHGKLLEPVSCAQYKEACPNFSGATGTMAEEKAVGGMERLYGVSVLQNKRWVLVIIEDPTEQLSPLFTARHLGALIGLAGILVIVIGAFFTSRSMMKELEGMERKKAASEDLVISSKMAALGKMAAGIAHEINNPLAVIGEKAGWMKDLLKKEDLAHSKNFQEFSDSVGKIEHHINRAKKITHRLLSFGRRMEPVTERVDVNQTLEDTIEFLINEARYRNNRNSHGVSGRSAPDHQ